MLSVLLSALSDVIRPVISLFSDLSKDIVYAVLVILLLKALAEYLKNRVDPEWLATAHVQKAEKLSDVLQLDWEPYAYIMKQVLVKQGYKIAGSWVNWLSGIDIVAEKDRKRLIYRFGRSTAETITVQVLSDLQAKAQKSRADSCCAVTAGTVSSQAGQFAEQHSIEIVEHSAFVDLINNHLNGRLCSNAISGFPNPSEYSSDNDLMAA